MSEAYVAAPTVAPSIHSLGVLTPQTIYEALVGLRPASQRARLIASTVPDYRLDRTLRTGRVVKVAGAARGDLAYLTLVVRLADGTARAVAVTVDRTRRAPVVSAVVL